MFCVLVRRSFEDWMSVQEGREHRTNLINTSGTIVGREPGPTGRRTSLHPQQQTYSQAQRRQKVGQIEEEGKRII